MNLYLSMSIAGTIPLAVYFLLKLWQGENSSLRWRMRLLKLPMFFYLCPFQVLKYQVPALFPDFFYRNIFGPADRLYLKREGYWAVPDFSGEYTLQPILLIFLALVWLLAATGFIIFQIVQYIRMLQKIRKDSISIPTPSYAPHTRRKITFRTCVSQNSPFTFGIFKPCIVLPDQKFTYDDQQMILLHEQTHVRNWDILHKLICFIICMVHCFNPATWFLLREYNIVSEQLCDEQVIKAFPTKKSRKAYALLLVAAAGKYTKAPHKTAYLNSNREKQMKKRIDYIMSTRKQKSGIISLLFILSIFTSSLTAIAYQEYSIAPETMEFLVDQDDFEVYSYRVDAYIEQIESLSFPNSGVIFIPDGNDEIQNLPLRNPLESRKSCSHSYKTGQIYHHKRNTSDGCTITIYEAKLCQKCSHYIILRKINSLTSEICTQ